MYVPAQEHIDNKCFDELNIPVGKYIHITNNIEYMLHKLKSHYKQMIDSNNKSMLYIASIVTIANDGLVLKDKLKSKYLILTPIHNSVLIQNSLQFDNINSIMDSMVCRTSIKNNNIYCYNLSGIYRPSEDNVFIVLNILKRQTHHDLIIKHYSDLFYLNNMSDCDAKFINDYFKYNEIFYEDQI